MIMDITNAISKQLYKLFGKEYTIYLDDVKQGLKEPCFIITVIQQERSDYLAGRYNISIPIDIIYIPKQDNHNVYSVSKTLLDNFDLIESIDCENKYIGRHMRSEVIEKELHFFVTYSCNRSVIDEENKMGEMIMEGVRYDK